MTTELPDSSPQNLYPDHYWEFSGDSIFQPKELLETPVEAREQAADIANVGSVALASEAAIEGIPADPGQLEVASPITKKMLRRKFFIDFESGKMSRKRDPDMVESDTAVRDLHEELQALEGAVDPSRARSFLEGRVDRFRRHISNLNRDFLSVGNTDMIMDDLDHSPFLESLKMMGGGKEKHWFEWLSYGASEEQVINFAQWYKGKLDEVTNPELREPLVEGIKGDYVRKINTAMTDGWIDRRHQTDLQKRIGKAQVKFFSPFGRMTQHAGGLRRGNAIALPVGSGEHIATHELGHIFAGVDPSRMYEHLKDTFSGIEQELGKETADQALLAVYTLLNEGFNEHMTQALIDGAPEVISPKERAERGVETEIQSLPYAKLREAFAYLLTGPEDQEEFSASDMSHVVDAMVSGDFEEFARIVDSRWGREGVLKEFTQAIAKTVKENPAAGAGVIYAGNLLEAIEHNSTLSRHGDKLAGTPA